MGLEVRQVQFVMNSIGVDPIIRPRDDTRRGRDSLPDAFACLQVDEFYGNRMIIRLLGEWGRVEIETGTAANHPASHDTRIT